MALQNSNFLLVTSTISIGVLFTAIWLTFRLRKRRGQNSNEFVKAGKIHELFIYPIKSCKPKNVNWLDCGERGPINGEERDRHFLLIDALQDNLFLTARVYPKMVLVEANIQDQMLIVQFPSIDENSAPKLINVNLKEVSRRNQIRRARSWPASQQRQMSLNSSSSLHRDMRTEGLDCGDEIGEAFNEFLGVPKDKREFRLIWFANDQLFSERDQSSKGNYWVNNPVPEVNDKIGYSDLASYMAFSLGSLEDLNAHLAGQDIKIDSRNFRPNLVISGLPPFDEDCWLRIRTGEAEFICYKPCTRCILTTVDPITGEKCNKMEPLKELRKYRLAPGKLYEQYKDSPIFGVNMAIVKAGRVKIGDPVLIQYKPNPF